MRLNSRQSARRSGDTPEQVAVKDRLVRLRKPGAFFDAREGSASTPDDHFIKAVLRRVGVAQKLYEMSNSTASADVRGVYAEKHTAKSTALVCSMNKVDV